MNVIKQQTQHLDSNMPGRRVFDYIMKTLWSLYSFDDFDNYMKLICARMIRGYHKEGCDKCPLQISKTSVLGRFIRQCYIDYLNLKFTEAESLWRATLRYRADSLEDWRRRFPHAGELNVDDSVFALVKSAEVQSAIFSQLPAGLSKADIDGLCEWQISRMQVRGDFVSAELKVELENLALPHADQPDSLYYLKYVNIFHIEAISS